MSTWDIITVTFNSSTQIENNWNWHDGKNSRIKWIAIDNNSKDNTVQTLRNYGATIIELEENIGFARANNLAFSNSNSPYILFANPDLRIDVNDLEMLEDTLNKFPGISAPQLINLDGTIQNNGRGIPYLTAKLAHRSIPPFKYFPWSKQYLPHIQEGAINRVTWLMGAAIAVKRDDFEMIGKWNEKFFIYYEDHELGLRTLDKNFCVTLDARVTWQHEWARATKSFSFKPWQREISSAIKFYSMFPKYLK